MQEILDEWQLELEVRWGVPHHDAPVADQPDFDEP
jgi:hypothetical protein